MINFSKIEVNDKVDLCMNFGNCKQDGTALVVMGATVVNIDNSEDVPQFTFTHENWDEPKFVRASCIIGHYKKNGTFDYYQGEMW